MYLEFFGLKEQPFNITPDPKFLYFSARHREAFDHLTYGIEMKKGFITLVGEVGSGKTTLCRAVLANLPKKVQTALVLNPSLTGNQLLRSILKDLGVVVKGRDRLAYIEQLNNYLLFMERGGFNVAVFIDEAQNLSPEVMEEIRLLSNLETDQHKLMQIVLAGQPELRERLAKPELRQLRQRIMVHCKLEALNELETELYLAHRLFVAGAREGVGFDSDAVRLEHRSGRGIPRLINTISDRAMLAAYVAGSLRVKGEHVKKALQEVELSVQ
jgi:general secretion pathway protein A